MLLSVKIYDRLQAKPQPSHSIHQPTSGTWIENLELPPGNQPPGKGAIGSQESPLKVKQRSVSLPTSPLSQALMTPDCSSKIISLGILRKLSWRGAWIVEIDDLKPFLSNHKVVRFSIGVLALNRSRDAGRAVEVQVRTILHQEADLVVHEEAVPVAPG